MDGLERNKKKIGGKSMRKILISVIAVIAVALTLLPAPCIHADTDVLPEKLEAPQNVTVEVKAHEDGKPYFEVKWANPRSILELVSYWDDNGDAPLGYQIDLKLGDGKWRYDTGESISGNSLHAGDDETGVFAVNNAPYDPINEGLLDTVDIKSNSYSLRVRYSYYYSDDAGDHYMYSSFSNTASIGADALYKGASSWAVTELDKAAGYGLITDRIKDNMKGPITREEFAELAARFYRVYTGKTAEAAPASTFTDTDNPEILRAYKLGIVNGVGSNKFDPKAPTNREQIAAMMNRAVGVIKPAADMSIAGAPVFSDEKQIAPYFLTNVKFMTKNGFLAGVGSNRFAPKTQCTREQAVLIAVRVYEAYK